MDDLCFIKPLTSDDVIFVNDQIGTACFRLYHKKIECLVVLNQAGFFEGILTKEDLLKHPDIKDTDQINCIYNKLSKYIKADIKEQSTIVSKANTIFDEFDLIQQIPVINLDGIPTHFVVNNYAMRTVYNIDIATKILSDIKSMKVFLAKLQLFSTQHTNANAFEILSKVMEKSCTTKTDIVITLEDGTLYDVLVDNKQYFSSEIISLKNECFLDCGAYIGDTIQKFLKESNYKFDSIFSFEPNKTNYNLCLESLLQYDSIIRKKIKVFNYGLGKEENTLYFPKNKSAGGGISESNLLDNNIYFDKCYIKNINNILTSEELSKISFIKMDVEGYELDILKSLKDIIKQNKPKLAICIYHKPTDFFKIPLYIKKLIPEYKIYLRHHSNCAWETVCYAIL